MSSEESGNEDDNIITVHPLPWRSQYVSKMFLRIDAHSLNKKSSQAKRQSKTRQVGFPFTLSPPTGAPDWAIAKL